MQIQQQLFISDASDSGDTNVTYRIQRRRHSAFEENMHDASSFRAHVSYRII